MNAHRDAVRRLSRPPALGTIAALGVAALVAAAAALTAGDGSPERPPAARPPVVSMRGPTEALQRQFVDVVRTVSPQVVQVQTRSGLGSGIVFDRAGDVVTNAHVVGGARRFVVTLAGGRRLGATLLGADRGHDLAVLHLTGAAPVPADFAPSAHVQVGDLVLAIGNPLGLRSSVTQGIVSSLGRRVSEGNGVTLAPVVQTSAAINPGNSGGALVDLSGRVIGIPTLAALDPQMGGGQAPGIGFAIPSDTVRAVVARLLAVHRLRPTSLLLLPSTSRSTMHCSAFMALPVAVAVLAAGCGSDNGSSDSSGTSGTSGGIYGPSGTTSPAASIKPAANTAPATVGVRRGAPGQFLANAKGGRTLYLFAADHGTKSTCNGACAQGWPPLTTGGRPKATGGAKASLLGTTKRSDGSTQVTYGGHPLYAFAGDSGSGQINGQGVNAFGGLWWVVGTNGKLIKKG
jgi:S1-C subfamily serine protease/predicted lipoprotein with Yx(FWY)xxD motif